MLLDHYVGVISETELDLPHTIDSRSGFSWDNGGCVNKKAAWSGSMSSFRQNDILDFELDCNRHHLKLTNRRTGETDSISDLPRQNLRLFLLLRYPTSKVHLLQK